ncbi:YqxA family protein [Bacillus tuaregi]|uniref:YqxA family protein n=1 Tax=Bacillus tuaregi TaxID=1816695 RepID=UPI0008F8D277|nr:YqxA family protein [Bacillus tuaregi]
MKMFMLKSMLIAALMFVSVLFGMEQANVGIQNMKGYSNDQFNGAFTLKESADGELEASILGKDVSSHDLEKKKKELEEMKAFNFFSSLGKNLAGALSFATEKIIQLITGLFTGEK